MTGAHKRREPLAGGSPARYGNNDTANRAADVRELQGIATARQATQRPPRWPTPKGADALAELEALFPTQRPTPIQRRRR
jgi:hypothetical protein